MTWALRASDDEMNLPVMARSAVIEAQRDH
jgi:hypothetical protein